ncbi:PhzF family phenazine biosynthesis protein [Streptomyces lunalinharesii]|uniref:PhzF family phenazine biosynthesis protein n=1 Tax=Streptomyces lunalinharesii TaxID=333384 RepID=A0ABN3RJW2_9ACTN
MIAFETLRVFCGADGRHGNALGVVRNGAAIPGEGDRLAVAGRLGFSETVFVDDAARGVIDIYTPTARMAFAGHPCVGAAWLLEATQLSTPAGTVRVRRDGEFTWIAAPAAWSTGRTLRPYDSAAEVAGLAVPPPGEWIYAWAWEDEAAGRVRARAFPGRGDGIDEDEATGAAAMRLTTHLGRDLTIHQGEGSQIVTAVGPDGTIGIGGRVRRAVDAQPLPVGPNAS